MKLLLAVLSLVLGTLDGFKLALDPQESNNFYIEDQANIQSRIINGFAAKKGEVPYIVKLKIYKNSGLIYNCGGSIIDNSWILTAVHCIKDAYKVNILYGTTKFHKSQTVRTVGKENFFLHPYYDKYVKKNDIALIRTPHVEFSNLITKIKLDDGKKSVDGQKSLTCGWGYIDNNETKTEDLLCIVKNILSNAHCVQIVHVTDSDICTDALDGKDVCNGDSGGPLVVDSKLVGITSHGFCGYMPTVFTRVSAYLDWVRDTTAISSL